MIYARSIPQFYLPLAGRIPQSTVGKDAERWFIFSIKA